MKFLPDYDTRSLFQVGFSDWLQSGYCPLRSNYKTALDKRRDNAKVLRLLREAYPSYQHWFMHVGFKEVKPRKLQKKYQFLICPIGNTILPEEIKRGIQSRNLNSVHELLLTHTFTQMRLYSVLSDDNWKEFIHLLLSYDCYDIMEV